MRLVITTATAVLLVACSASEQAANEQTPLPTDAPVAPATPLGNAPAPAAPVENSVEGPTPTAAIEAPAQVVRRYYALLAAKDYVGAHKLWVVREGDLADGTFADQFSAIREQRGVVGTPGQPEGAAGSLFVTLPVQVSGVTTKGERFEEPQIVTLRRVNDVPGATAEQLQWRITKVDKPPH